MSKQSCTSLKFDLELGSGLDTIHEKDKVSPLNQRKYSGKSFGGFSTLNLQKKIVKLRTAANLAEIIGQNTPGYHTTEFETPEEHKSGPSSYTSS